MLVRTWNLFHGNAVPPEGRAFLAEMVRLAVADGPALVHLQELPAWALPRLAGWSGMQAFAELAAPPRIGPLPSTAEIGRVLTDLNHGVLRSTFAGQGNAILVAPGLRVLVHERLLLNERRFRAAQARRLGLGLVTRLAWAKERRVAQAVRVRRPDGSTLLAANLHSTSSPDERLADAEAIRAATWLEALAAPGEPILFMGDFNLRTASSRALPELAAWGFRHVGGAVVDHVLVRGLETGEVVRRTDEWRTVNGRLLSDHAPLEVKIE